MINELWVMSVECDSVVIPTKEESQSGLLNDEFRRLNYDFGKVSIQHSTNKINISDV